MQIDVCLTPNTIHLYELRGKIVVVTDVFRATSTMTAALHSGVEAVIPVSSLEECEQYQGEYYIKAAERGGSKVEGFVFGNSPFDYLDKEVSGKTLVMTTTNGTRAINLSKPAEEVLIGSFLNLSDTVRYLKNKKMDVLVVCAGWKGKFSMEDTLYAGALAKEFYTEETNSDSVFMAMELYENACKEGVLNYLKHANHYRRLSGFQSHKDIEYVLQTDKLGGVGKLSSEGFIELI